jgi:carbon-monoxide dehydrogenase large subunit
VTSSTAAIGSRLPRANARRHVEGRGAFVDDIVLPRMLHMAFLRSPHAHARILSIDTAAARALPGVVAVMTGAELAQHYKPWQGTHSNQPALKSPPQHAMVIDRARWHGEPVVAVAAESRAEAEDAVSLINVEWEALPAVADAEIALREGAVLVHPELGSNLAYSREVDHGNVKSAFASAKTVVEETFRFGRHTGVPLEARGLVAAYDPSVRKLTVHHTGQCPHMMQWLFGEILGLPERQVRVICRDVGGSFGLKIHVYGDEIATAVMAKRLGRPVKYICDRLEAFVTDVHARDHLVTARMALDGGGKITALEVDDLIPIGPYSPSPRGSITESNLVLNMTGVQYPIENYHARSRVVFQHKNVVSQYRAVGYPIAAAVAERMVDKAAAAAKIDPVELRRRNLVPDDAYPRLSVTGLKFEKLSHHACLDKLVKLVKYDELRREQVELRKKGIYRGIGLGLFVEGTGAGSQTFGPAGIRIGSQDGVTVRLDPSGDIACSAGVTEQGQGTDTILAQVVADAVGVDPRTICVTTGDTETTPFGGGTWGSRGTANGGAAAWLAGRALRDNILEVAAAMLKTDVAALDIRDGEVIGGSKRLTLKDVASTVYFLGHELPAELAPELMATRHFRLTGASHFFVNGVHCSHVEVNPDTGFVRLLKFWVVDDCGRVINPLLAEEQIRGGVVQGIGGALFENCLYDENGQMCNGNLADYLVPMAGEMPDIVTGHIESPTKMSPLGAKGVGESGVVGVPAAVLNAVNDALAPLGAKDIAETPLTPRVVLRALGKISR